MHHAKVAPRYLVLALCLLPSAFAARSAAPAPDVPPRLTDAAFWEMVTTFSEEGGYFASNNWVSNETVYQHVIPRLQTIVKPGGVYVGVGPDQNFTYLVALKPSLAFIVDIRRQNLLHHLMYKALFELSPTRADFVSRLFGKPRPAGLKDDLPADALMAAFMNRGTTAELINQTVDDMFDRLIRVHKFALSDEDRSTLLTVYQAFYQNGPGITYTGVPSYVSSPGNDIIRMQRTPFPAYSDLVALTDADGVNRGYLASEANYKVLRDMQLRNAIVPIVGDFGGPKALRMVADYIKSKGGRATTFYTSNVEQYLFQHPTKWRTYYENVAAMPLDDTSMFIRSSFGNSGAPTMTIVTNNNGEPVIVNRAPVLVQPGAAARPIAPFIQSAQLVCSVKELLAGVAAGRIAMYADVIEMSR
jgi:hypothetical protein